MKGHRRSSTVVLGWRPPAVRCTCLPSGHPVTVDVCAAVRGCLTSSACASEPLPKRTLMESIDVLAPLSSNCSNCSLSQGWCRLFSRRRLSYRCWRSPTLTRPTLGHRPIDRFLTCRCMLSKLLERFVARQLIEIDNIAAANLQPDRHLASDLSTP